VAAGAGAAGCSVAGAGQAVKTRANAISKTNSLNVRFMCFLLGDKR
jgi:hypothetical protein